MNKQESSANFNIGDIQAAEILRDAQDIQRTLDMQSGYEEASKEYEIEYLKTFVEDRDFNRRLREKYSRIVTWYLGIYSFFVALVVFVNGFSWKTWNADVTVVVVLVSSTSVAAIGLVGLVIKGLYSIK